MPHFDHALRGMVNIAHAFAIKLTMYFSLPMHLVCNKFDNVVCFGIPYPPPHQLIICSQRGQGSSWPAEPS